jgi:hypothetical protein
MGSSRSRPRRGHERPTHLAKVGSPANLEWEHRTHLRESFGGHRVRLILLALAIVSVAGLIVLTL